MRIRRTIAVAALAASLVVPPYEAGPALARERSAVMAYRGLGSWVDIYEYGAWAHPEEVVRSMKAHGVRTAYIETSNYSRPRAILYREGIRRFIEAAHAVGMRVVAWYLPGFRNPRMDLRRSMAAIRYRTPSGERFDSFALDIEAPVVPPELRTRRLLRLSRQIRRRAGGSYPLGAIIPSPRGMQRNPDYWPGFPYRGLADIYDVFVPMTYFSWRTQGSRGAHDYTSRNIRIIREETGQGSVPIHVIGGLGSGTSGPETRAFVHAIREHGILGASMYNYSETGTRHWRHLRRVPVNKVQTPPLPVEVGYLPALGNIPGADQSHPKEVFYRAGPTEGARVLRYEAYDVDAGEVAVWVNWRRLEAVPPTLPDSWSEPRVLVLPDSWLRDDDRNVIAFVADGSFPNWRQWGVRRVSLEAVVP